MKRKIHFFDNYQLYKNKLFFRIYANLIVLMIFIGVLCVSAIYMINHYRLQQYRESLVNGMSYVVNESLAHEPEEFRQYWIEDASYLLGVPIKWIDKSAVKLNYLEEQRLAEKQAVVRYREQSGTQVIIELDFDKQRYLEIYLSNIGERQIRALSIFVTEYLSKHEGEESIYLNQINQYFTYKLSIQPLRTFDLYSEQLGRLRQDKSLLLYQNNNRDASKVQIIAPIYGNDHEVLVFGPIPLFESMPLGLSLNIALIALLLLAIGVYSCIFPLDRKIRQVGRALDAMKAGNLTLRLPVQGHDEMATLALSFNNMVEHIQRLIEAQQELMRAVSHELRTPVARIRFALQMLIEEDDEQVRKMQVELIDRDIEELNTLIDEIMTYAKLEHGIPAFEFVEVSLLEVLKQVARETKALNTSKQIELIEPDESLIADAEYRYLHRVVQNLVGNAVRYAEKTVRISGGIEQGMAYICVEDDGAGIPESDRKRIFEAFARLDDSRTRSSGGYGLGLSIVGRIAYWFDGTVEVDDSPDLGGARFVMKWVAKRKSSPVEKRN